MKDSIKLYKELIKSPKTGIEKLIKESESPHGRNALIVLYILFFIPNLTMIIIGAESPIPPIVIIPLKYFYHYITFVGIPAQIPLFIMVSGIIYLLCYKNLQNSFREVFTLTTYSLSLPFFIYAFFEISLALYLIFTGEKIVPDFFKTAMFISMGITVIGHIYFLTLTIRKISNKKRAIVKSFLATITYWLFASLFFA